LKAFPRVIAWKLILAAVPPTGAADTNAVIDSSARNEVGAGAVAVVVSVVVRSTAKYAAFVLVADDPTTVNDVVDSVMLEENELLADAGATDIKPRPSADTATSAMRLRSVFVDICFLSISRDREFPDLGFG
jgi:hypothetical protein